MCGSPSRSRAPAAADMLPSMVTGPLHLTAAMQVVCAHQRRVTSRWATRVRRSRRWR
jgi:hypothetical protein